MESPFDISNEHANGFEDEFTEDMHQPFTVEHEAPPSEEPAAKRIATEAPILNVLKV